MIECSDENIWYKKRRRVRNFKKKRFAAFFIALIVCGALFAYYKFFIVTQLIGITADYSYTLSAEAVNEAVMESLKDGVKYSDIINVEKNAQGDVVMMSADSYKINLINREVASKADRLLKEKLEAGIPIPALAFSGIRVLSGYGFEVKYKVAVVSSVICNFSSEFSSVAINQTRHSVYLDVESTVIIEIPLGKQTKKCKTSILVSEAVLVGKVPEIYLNGKLFG